MGNKVHPKALRLSQTNTWGSKWFATKNFTRFLREDVTIRVFLMKELKDASVSEIVIERTANGVTVVIRSGKPGVIIGRSGVGIEELKKKILKKFFAGRKVQLNVNVEEVSKPLLSAALVGQQIIVDIEKRLPFRRSMKMAIEKSMKGGALGVKVRLSGRLNGAEISRRETLVQGKIPLHNLRADIDFYSEPARTIFGAIGIKVWIYKGDVFRDVETKKVEAKAYTPVPAKA